MRKMKLREAISRCIGYLVFMLIFVLVLNQFIGLAVTEKTWFEKLYSTFIGGGVGGLVGVGVGLLIGGIGIATGGWAIGVVGWLAVGMVGGTAGALGGSIFSIMSSPESYDIHYLGLASLFIGGILSGLIGKKLYYIVINHFLDT
jgi:hypothetical protein